MKAWCVFSSVVLLACAACAQDGSQPQQIDATGSASNATESQPNRVHVEHEVSQGLLIHKVRPVYPKKAIKHHIQGTVVLHALIGKDGIIRDLQVVSGPTELTQAALDAVRQWRYKPYLLDGELVEVDTTINVNFKLEGS